MNGPSVTLPNTVAALLAVLFLASGCESPKADPVPEPVCPELDLDEACVTSTVSLDMEESMVGIFGMAGNERRVVAATRNARGTVGQIFVLEMPCGELALTQQHVVTPWASWVSPSLAVLREVELGEPSTLRVLDLDDDLRTIFETEDRSADNSALQGRFLLNGSQVVDMREGHPAVSGFDRPSGGARLDGLRGAWVLTSSPTFGTLPDLADASHLDLWEGLPELGVNESLTAQSVAFQGDHVWLSVATDFNERRWLLEVEFATGALVRAVELDWGHTVLSMGDTLLLRGQEGVRVFHDDGTLGPVMAVPPGARLAVAGSLLFYNDAPSPEVHAASLGCLRD